MTAPVAEYTGNGSTVLYSFSFDYLDESHVQVTLDGVPTTAFSFDNASTIRFNTAPASGVLIRIFRVTPDSSPLATIFNGSAIPADALNTTNLQLLYLAQERAGGIITGPILLENGSGSLNQVPRSRGPGLGALWADSVTRIVLDSSQVVQKPTFGTVVKFRMWGGGGAGAASNSTAIGAGGGGGGEYAEFEIPVASLPASFSVYIGEGGVGRSTAGAGSTGGDTELIIGALSPIKALGGKGGGSAGNLLIGGVGGGSAFSTADTGGTGGSSTTTGGSSIYGGGGGGSGGNNAGNRGGSSLYGGAGGSGCGPNNTFVEETKSRYGGQGGGFTSQGLIRPAFAPGGGGSAGYAVGAGAGVGSGSGAKGRCIIEIY